MYLIVGLGNPEPEYSNTRHNMGFDTINKVASKLNLGYFKYEAKMDAEYIKQKIADEEYLFLKPQTYMNLSGDSILRAINYYKIPKENVVVVYDDMDTDKGKIRIRKTGGAGGHNGIKSILPVTQDFLRIRVGIGRCKVFDERTQIDYVISKIPKSEKEILDKGTDLASDAVIELINNGFNKDLVMNKFNRKNEEEI